MPTRTTANCNRLLAGRGIPYPRECRACGAEGPCLFPDDKGGVEGIGDASRSSFGGARVIIAHEPGDSALAQASALASLVRAVAPAVEVEVLERVGREEGTHHEP